ALAEDHVLHVVLRRDAEEQVDVREAEVTVHDERADALARECDREVGHDVGLSDAALAARDRDDPTARAHRRRSRRRPRTGTWARGLSSGALLRRAARRRFGFALDVAHVPFLVQDWCRVVNWYVVATYAVCGVLSPVRSGETGRRGAQFSTGLGGPPRAPPRSGVFPPLAIPSRLNGASQLGVDAVQRFLFRPRLRRAEI